MASEISCDTIKILSPVEKWNCKMPEGMGLQISQHPLTMRDVVNVIVAMERFKGSVAQSAFNCSGHGTMLNLFLDSIVEEQIIHEQFAAPPQFTRTGELQCNITDNKKKNWILLRNSMELHAVMLQGGNSDQKVVLNLSTYVHPAPTTEARPVALGIKDTDLYLSCHMEDDTPSLHLEAVEDKSNLMRIGTDSDLVRFLFYKRDTGISSSTLMSACFPGWYISTDEEVNKPVEMCEQTSSRNLTFTIQRQR